MATKAQLAAAIKVLPSVALIANDVFAAFTPEDKTKILALNEGKTIEFIDSFYDMQDSVYIRERLLAGYDISRELEFNNIVMTEAETAAVKVLSGLLKKIAALPVQYPWLPAQTFSSFKTTPTHIERQGRKISHKTAKTLWNNASKLWFEKTEVSTDVGYISNYDTYVKPDEIRIGCQHIPRAEVEAMARQLKWEPNIK